MNQNKETAARAGGCPCIPYPPVPKDFLPQVRLFPPAFPLPLLVGSLCLRPGMGYPGLGPYRPHLLGLGGRPRLRLDDPPPCLPSLGLHQMACLAGQAPLRRTGRPFPRRHRVGPQARPGRAKLFRLPLRRRPQKGGDGNFQASPRGHLRPNYDQPGRLRSSGCRPHGPRLLSLLSWSRRQRLPPLGPSLGWPREADPDNLHLRSVPILRCR